MNSVAFLVNLPDFEDAVERVAPCVPERSLHLNLVEGRPLSLSPDSPLLDADGWFRYPGIATCSPPYYRSSGCHAERASAPTSEPKPHHNSARFSAAFPAPVAVDSHQHTHMFPFVLPEVAGSP